MGRFVAGRAPLSRRPQGRKRARWRARLPLVSALSVAAAFVAWFVVAKLRLVDPLLLPGPLEVLETGLELWRDGYRQDGW